MFMASTNRWRGGRSVIRSAINLCGRTNPLQVLQVALLLRRLLLLLLLLRFKGGGNNLPHCLEITFVRKGGEENEK